jgi:uncharacterized protein
MLVNLSDVLTSEGRQMTREVPLEMTRFEIGRESFEIIEKSPVSFVFTNVKEGKAKISGRVEITFQTSCARCLTGVRTTLKLEFEHFVVSPGIEDTDVDDLSYMEGFQLDVDAFVHNEILVNWPVKILCREDCKGICPVCGQNLNMGECGCDTFVPDPRMAVIQDIFNADKEV